MEKRAIIIVLDSVGIGELPDAKLYGDEGSNTLKHIYNKTNNFSLPNLEKLGLTNIDGSELEIKVISPSGAFCKMAEVSPGKDTTTGHWELAGVQLSAPFQVYPNGFSDEIISQFKQITGYDILCNKPYSGTEVIKDYGEEHIKTGKLIVYTSADSVFQIAAHENIIPLETLYNICSQARELLNKYNVGRVIARPFIGENSTSFTRTTNRKDFSMKPTEKTLLDNIKQAGLTVSAIGKIEDIFANQGVTQSVHTTSNDDGINRIINDLKTVENGLIFANLVDFDMIYGHRNDLEGYANALMHFDSRLPEIIANLKYSDLLFITADHGCDPTTSSTDHSREYVPLLIFGHKIKPINLGTLSTFSDLAATIAEYLNVEPTKYGSSFLNKIV